MSPSVPVCWGYLPVYQEEKGPLLALSSSQWLFLLPSSPLASQLPVCICLGRVQVQVTAVPLCRHACASSFVVSIFADLLISLIEPWTPCFPISWRGHHPLRWQRRALIFAVSPPRVFRFASISAEASFPVVPLIWKSGVLANEQMNFLRETLGK